MKHFEDLSSVSHKMGILDKYATEQAASLNYDLNDGVRAEEMQKAQGN